MVMKLSDRRTTFPALRCEMGDWVYYITCFRFSDVAEWVKETDEIHSSEELRDLIQREISKRVEPITEYLLEQKERFFNAIVLGVYGGAPQWYPIEVGNSPVLGDPDLDDDARESVGLLRFTGDEKIFAIDGQHRVVAIKEALPLAHEIGNEEICVIFVAHGTDQKGMRRTRRLFSTLNRYAVPVSKGEIVALSEDDAFAIVTRRLVEEFPLLQSNFKGRSGFVAFGKTAPVPASDRCSLTSVLALYDIVMTLHTPILDKERRKELQRLKHRRPADAVLEEIFEEQKAYWQLLQKNIKEYSELFSSSPEEELASHYRMDGGHLMFRPVGQQAFARAVRIMMDRGRTMRKAVVALSQVPMDMNSAPWRFVLWNPQTKRINSKVSPLLPEGIFLHFIGEPPRSPDFNLLDEYRKMVGSPKATL